jgi:hypothetical protein
MGVRIMCRFLKVTIFEQWCWDKMLYTAPDTSTLRHKTNSKSNSSM